MTQGLDAPEPNSAMAHFKRGNLECGLGNWDAAVRLYRQRTAGDWREVLAQVSADLRALKDSRAEEGLERPVDDV